jgi:uncharacterized protein YdeI (YjbR/CyaY-like superfamily)
MGTKDPRVDAYIERSADFAKPVLTHLRSVVHEGCPTVEETIKWSFPHFMYEGILCSMAAFTQHCAFGFWKARMILEQEESKNQEAMGNFGRLTKVADLPPKKVLVGYIKAAMKLNEDRAKSPVRSKPKAKRALVVPDDLESALKKNKRARATFDGFSPTHRREYVEWITEAKSDETRSRRLATAIEQMADGRTRHWKYARA